MAGAGCAPGGRVCLANVLVQEMVRLLAERLCDELEPHAVEPALCATRIGAVADAAAATATAAAAAPVTREELRSAGMASGSDKVHDHGYHRFYWRYLPRRGHIAIFEIGVGTHGGSLVMWRKLYPHARLVALEYPGGDGAAILPADSQTTILQGDQADVGTLRDCATHGPFDLIVDDGSHVPEHQMLAFETLFAAVKPGGAYIIEDIETSYWRPGAQIYGQTVTGDVDVVEALKRIADRVNNEYHREGYPPFASDVETVTFAHNAIIITKREANEADAYFYDREYLWNHLGLLRPVPPS